MNSVYRKEKAKEEEKEEKTVHFNFTLLMINEAVDIKPQSVFYYLLRNMGNTLGVLFLLFLFV